MRNFLLKIKLIVDYVQFNSCGSHFGQEVYVKILGRKVS